MATGGQEDLNEVKDEISEVKDLEEEILDPVEGKRIHKHTERGKERYIKLRDEHMHKLSTHWTQIEVLVSETKEIKSSKVNVLDGKLLDAYLKYTKLCNSYEEFLKRNNTVESNSDLIQHIDVTKFNKPVVDNALRCIDEFQ